MYISNRRGFNAAVRAAIADQQQDRITWDVIDGTTYISCGNLKLESKIHPDGDGALFLIFNLPARRTCPFRTELCSRSCYAVKAEQAYSDVLPCRERNLAATRDVVKFTAFMVRALHYVCGLKKYRDAPRIIFRIHESGDFYSPDYMAAWFTIARMCRDINNIRFTAYTKSIQYYDVLRRAGWVKPRNLYIRYSIWSDTDPADIALAASYHMPIYTAFADCLPAGFYECRCADCGRCRQCYTGRKKIACKIH